MRPIRASEVGSYLYCRRAWWLSRQGVESANQAELSAGIELHRQHGRQVLLAGFLRLLGLIFLLAALLLFVVYLTRLVLGV